MPLTNDFGLEAAEFSEKISALGLDYAKDFFWYHAVELPGGLVTPGVYDFRKSYPLYGFPENMKGMRVLDVGAATGFFSFEFWKRGAQVVSLELPNLDSLDRFPGQGVERTIKKISRMTPGCGEVSAEELYFRLLEGPFEFCRKLLGAEIDRRYGTVYNLPEMKLGKFDFVFLGDVLLHTINPLAALAAAASCGDLLILAQEMPECRDGKPAMLYAGGTDPLDDEAQWWLPDPECFLQILKKLGFAPEVYGRHPVSLRPSGYSFEQTVIRARRT